MSWLPTPLVVWRQPHMTRRVSGSANMFADARPMGLPTEIERVTRWLMGHDEFDPIELAREKVASRRQDDDDIASGRASREDVQRRNAFIPAEAARGARIVSWGYGEDDGIRPDEQVNDPGNISDGRKGPS